MTLVVRKNSQKIILVRMISLGCPKNFVDTEQAAASLFTHGFGIAYEDSGADVYFINTCAFLAAAREEAVSALKTAEAWKKARPGRLVICAGCLVSWDKDGSCRKDFPFVDAWLPVAGSGALGSVIESLFAKKELPVCAPDLDAPRIALTPPHYAWLRISDGCCNCCSYCLIPSIRGPLHSRPMDSIVQEAENLLKSGVRELLVIAQDTAGYGRDIDGKPRMAELLRKLDSFPGDYLLRLLYLHPVNITPDLLTAMCESRHLVRCLEIPIQHTADSVLKRMNRHISEADQRKILAILREKGFALRTTLMTGFPGETEEDFQNLYDYVKAMEFERLGVFAWSSEPGTAAASMTELFVPEEIREARRDKLMRLQQRISKKRNQKLIGTETDVIVDEVFGDGSGLGRTLLDMPEIDNSVLLRGLQSGMEGKRIRVQIEAADAYELRAVRQSEKVKKGKKS